MLNRSSLHDHVLALRRDAIHRSDGIFFRPIPLFVLVAHSMENETIYRIIEHAIDDGYGDPEDLDPSDGLQTSRLETAILERADSFSVEELITIEYAGWPSGLQYSICIAETSDGSALVVHHSHDVPSFQAFAVGDAAELLAELRDAPEVLLSRLEADNDKIAGVAIRRSLNLSVEDVTQVVLALTGLTIVEDHILRADRLLGVSP